MTPSIRHRIGQELRTSQLHWGYIEPPCTNSASPSFEVDSDSDFDMKPHLNTKQVSIPHLGESDDENYLTCPGSAIPAPKKWDELDCTLQSVVPPDYSYLVEEYQELPKATYSGAPKACFQAQFCVNLQNEEEVQQWLTAFQSHNKCTYRVTRTYKPSLKRVKYKVDMHCQHFQKKLTEKQVAQASRSKRKALSLISNTRKKKTQCPSKLLITVKIPSKTQLKKYPQVSERAQHPAVIKLIFDHNHPLESAHALSFRPIAPETKEKYFSLFRMGHSAASARFYYETLLLQNESDDDQQRLADRAVNPTSQDVSRLYNLWRQTEMGSDNGKGLFECLEKEIQVYNERWGEHGGQAKLQRFETPIGDTDNEETQNDIPPKAKRSKLERHDPLILVVCTPLMARAHTTIPQSAEIMFCDSTSSLDRFNTSLFILSTCHPAGGIPLGIFMTSDEKEETILAALHMLGDVLPKNAFYGNGVQKGPALVMTDDSMTEKEALKTMWPMSTQLLCVFHFLQRRWTWLWDGKNRIYHKDRAVLINLVKTLVYAPSELLLRQRYIEFKKNPTVLKYPHFIHHMDSLFPRCQEWALCFRTNLPVRGNHTNNYSEASIGILKELIFSRIKAYNLVQMFEFATEALELYHQRKLLSVAHNRVDHYISVKYRGLNASKIPKEHIQ